MSTRTRNFHYLITTDGETERFDGSPVTMESKARMLMADGHDVDVVMVSDNNGHRTPLTINPVHPSMRVMVTRTSKWA